MGKFKSDNLSYLYNKITSLGRINLMSWVKLSLLFSLVEWFFTSRLLSLGWDIEKRTLSILCIYFCAQILINPIYTHDCLSTEVGVWRGDFWGDFTGIDKYFSWRGNTARFMPSSRQELKPGYPSADTRRSSLPPSFLIQNPMSGDFTICQCLSTS